MWMIVRCHSKMSKKVAPEVEGIVPVTKQWTKPARKHSPVISEVPTFPGWVFAPYSDEVYVRLRRIRGVRGVLKNGTNEPILLDDGAMRLVLATENLNDPAVVRINWAVGMQVKVLGLDGWISSEVSPGMFIVDVGANFPLTVHSDHLCLPD